MNLQVFWTEEAKTSFNENLRYLSQKWDLATINRFLDLVDEVLENISCNPNLYPVYLKSDQVHKCVLNKHIILFYRVPDKKRIDLITFWNTHQDPNNLEF